jgi:hypothetical protein
MIGPLRARHPTRTMPGVRARREDRHMEGVLFWTLLTFAFVIAALGIVWFVFRYWWRASRRGRADDQSPV